MAPPKYWGYGLTGATNMGLSAAFAEITEATEMTKSTGSWGETTGLQNTVALQGVEQLCLCVSRYTLTLRYRPEAPKDLFCNVFGQKH